MKAFVAIIAGCFVLSLSSAAAAAPEDVANDISMHVMSPFCPGVTLHDCPTENATALRERIVTMVEQGFTRGQILDFIEREYGVATRATPDPSGTGILVWLLPGVAAIGGAAIAWHLARRWVRVPATPEGYNPNVHVTEEDRRRLERELKRFKDEG